MIQAVYPWCMLVSRRGIAERLVGRHDVLAELHDLLTHAQRADYVPVAMVTGEAGIGKTRLLRELIHELDPDVAVVAGQAREGDAQRPFALLRDAVEEHLDPAGQIPAELERWQHPLGHLLEPLVVLRDHPQDGHEHHQEELARAGVALLRYLAGSVLGLVVFEDLHWADAESLEVFARLASADAPLLLAGSFRPEDFDRRHPLGGLLTQLERQGEVSHLAIEGFSRQELAQFLEEACGQTVGAATLERLHRRTQGNPFFLEELLAAHMPPGRVSGAAASLDVGSLETVPLPWSTNEAILRRLERFDEHVRRMLQSAAVLGDRFDVHLLAGVLGENDSELLRTLAQLVRDGLLVEHSATTFGFRHALTREVTAGELLASERREIHVRALDLLAGDDSASTAELADHALAAGRNAEAAAYAREAALVARHAGPPREALRLAQVALEHGAETTDMQELAAVAALRLGEFEQARQHAERWRSLARDAGDLQAQVQAGCHLSWVHRWAGERDAAWEALRQAVYVAEELEPCPAQAAVMAAHARFLITDKQPTAAVARADEAIEIAERIQDPRTRARAWLYKFTGILDSHDHQRPEDLELAATLADRAREESARLGDLDTLAGALHQRLVPDQPDDLPVERAWQLLDEAKDVADRHGLEGLAAKTTLLEAHLAVMDGDQARVEEALTAARRANLPDSEANWLQAIDAMVGLETGDLDRAEAAHQAQFDLVGPPHQAEAEVDLLVVATAIAAHRSEPAQAQAALERTGQAIGSVCPCAAANWWEAAISALDAGVQPEVVRELMDRDAPVPMPRHAGLVEHLRGVLLAAEGRRDEAIEALQQALAHERRQRRAPLLADAHHRLAELLATRGDRQQALAHIATTLELLERWPGRRRDRAEALRRRLGDGKQAPHELFTPRELEVVKLVARGYTNSDIAERLFITRKTAATHISNILTKTGFDGRTEVAVWAVYEGIVDNED